MNVSERDSPIRDSGGEVLRTSPPLVVQGSAGFAPADR